MATKTFEELKQLAIQIRDEKTNKQNTATRVGTAMLEHINKLEQDYYDKTKTDKELKERDDKLTELESYFSTLGVDIEKITLTKGYNIKTNESIGGIVELTPREFDGWGYAIVEAGEGDSFCISGDGGDAPRLWAFVDSENKLIQAKEALNSVTVINELVIAPANSAKLIINSNNADIYAARSFKYINNITKNINSLICFCGLYGFENVSKLNWKIGYNIDTGKNIGEIVDLSEREYAGWGYIIADCEENDSFIINGIGGDAPRLFAFVDGQNRIVSVAEATNGVITNNLIVTAPKNTKKIIINSNNAANYISFKGVDTILPQLNKLNQFTEAQKDFNENQTNFNNKLSLYGFDKTNILNWKLGYNINTGVSIGEVVDLSEREYAGWGYIISECTEGDIFVINGKGGVAPRLWAFVDSDNRLLSVASAVNSELQYIIVKAPSGSNKIIINSNNAALYNCGKVTDVLTKDIDSLKESTSKIETEVDNAVNRIENLEQSNDNGTYILENEADIINCYINGIKYKEDIENVIMNFAQSGIDKAVNVPSFVIIDNVVYATYFTNRTTGQEDTSKHIAVLAYADLTEKNITHIDVLNIGDEIEGYEVTAINDIIAFKKNDTEILLSIAAYFNNDWHHVYSIFNVTTKTVGETKTCKFYVGEDSVEFSKKNIKTILDNNNIKHLSLDGGGCVGLTPTLSTRIENDVTYYYTGVFSDKFNGIVKSKDLIDWIFVATPYHLKNAVWENSIYVSENIAYCFSRQNSNQRYGILTTYDLVNREWGDIVYINDSSSRGDFFESDGNLYLVYSPNTRSYSCIMKIDKNSIDKSHNIQMAQFSYYSAVAFPYVDVYNGTLYIIYNKSHTAINLSSIRLAPLSSDSVQTIFEKLLL